MASQGSNLQSSAPGRLEGKVAIVTGGASGIGESTVRLFVENGAVVVIADIQDDRGSTLVGELGPHIVAYRHCNVSIERDMENLVKFTLDKWGKLDIMFNNAGILGKSMTSDATNVDMDDFDHVMSVNVRGIVLGVKYASKAMVGANIKGSIICTSSVAGIQGGVASMAYVVSKHAILGIMRAACSDLGQYGIRVNCVSPSAAITPLSLSFFRQALSNPLLDKESIQGILDNNHNLVGHSLSTLDIAFASLYLASDDSKFVSGLNLVVDGGTSSTSQMFKHLTCGQ
ncbi:hypothetical protein GOP47_0021395 [Adiantum capillus-veneris]|uniref:Uncharacterized protein n=1 Tax=Adiantum capillus-veneris TaxID=13818 RepID=A0A9D4U7E6_ADICA|nr:hypothetical protein GOP47_0021395 [Adiantum capillus-veneris]